MPLQPQPRGGQGEGRSRGLRRLLTADPIHLARCVEERVHLTNELFDVERNLDSLADITRFRAGFGCLPQNGGLIEACSHQNKLHHQGGCEELGVPGDSFRLH